MTDSASRKIHLFSIILCNTKSLMDSSHTTMFSFQFTWFIDISIYFPSFIIFFVKECFRRHFFALSQISMPHICINPNTIDMVAIYNKTQYCLYSKQYVNTKNVKSKTWNYGWANEIKRKFYFGGNEIKTLLINSCWHSRFFVIYKRKRIMNHEPNRIYQCAITIKLQ